MELAPIVLFVYNRPWHTEQTLESLLKNKEAALSELFIYCDGPKPMATQSDLEKINDVRQIIRNKQWCKEVQIIESRVNIGLANSVIAGVTEVVNRFGKVIVLEDDVVLSTHFLQFMNQAIRLYDAKERVMMISGYNFPVSSIPREQKSFFWPKSSSQAWGTWKRVWDKFDPLATGYEQLKVNKKLARKFNMDGVYPYDEILINQMESDKVSSWAVMLGWVIFKNNGLVLYPDKSLISNTGWDGSGVHSTSVNPYKEKDWDPEYSIIYFPDKIRINHNYFKAFKQYLNPAYRRQNKIQKVFSKVATKILRYIKKLYASIV